MRMLIAGSRMPEQKTRVQPPQLKAQPRAAALPDLSQETAFAEQGYRYLFACDEVGRGAIAGPVAIGLVLLRLPALPHPASIRDSKLVSEKKRPAAAADAASWVDEHAVGYATAAEIDEFGIMRGLAFAAARAKQTLLDRVGKLALEDTVLLLDGSHNYLRGETELFPERIVVRQKADRDCASVAAASLLAKTERDELMAELAALHPDYGWERNKGYGSASHREVIERIGPSDQHRLSWLGREQT